jgi:7-cyano-7-deazaguanine synthase
VRSKAKSNAILLLSAGLDSLTNLVIAAKESHIVLALTFDYGQRSAKQEIKMAKKICKHYGITHEVISIPWLKKLTKTALVNRGRKIPSPTEKNLNEYAVSLQNAKAVWVPNRNGVFINIAAAYAESLGAGEIVVGFNKEEAATFPDNSEKYLKQAVSALSSSTLSKVKVRSYTLRLNKKQIVKKALEAGAPLQYIWSCYEGKSKMCGECESCKRLQRALSANQIH